MYLNDQDDKSRYEYHYNYRPAYTTPIPTPEEEPPKRRGRIAIRVTAFVLAAAILLSGAFFAGRFMTWEHADEEEQNPTTQLMVSDRPKTEITTVSVNGSDKLTYPEIYAANVDSCVSINVSSISYNFFGQAVQNASSGSGFIITTDGYIVTNYHVISGGTSVSVTLNNGQTFDAQVIGGEEDYDIAVLKIDPGKTALKCVLLGESSDLLVGEDVLTIGNPLGELTFSMSEGIVSCLDREINVDGTPFNMIQITTAVNSGNSGGPLFNTYGEVVGIVSAKYSSSSSSASVEGLGFAIPIDDVLSMIRDIMENGQVTTRPYLGIMAAYDSQPSVTGVKSGVYVESVFEDGPAARAGLQGGDVITMIGVTTITNRDDISSLSKSYEAGDTVTVTYVRERRVYTTELTFGSTMDAPSDTSTQQNQQQGQQYAPGPDYYGYGDMDDFFDYYFGSGQYNRGNAA